MSNDTEQRKRSAGWMGIHRGHQARPSEWLAEKFIFLVSLSAIAMVMLIFLFVAREALPVLFGQTNTALIQPVIPTDELDKHSPAEIQTYLELTPEQYATMDKDTIKTLMDVKVEALNDIPESFKNDADAKVNTSQWHYLFQAHQWNGYDRPEYIWQPVGQIKKFNIIPLFIGTLKT
ncbi:MAG TPA: hypothetical protein VF607_10055, partial [Verrucomicrobiae bacterium]